jgi:hypothetical protein
MMGDVSVNIGYTTSMIVNTDTAYPATRYEAGIGLCRQPALITLPQGATLRDLAEHERREYGAWRANAANYVAPDAAGRLAAVRGQIAMLRQEEARMVAATVDAFPARALGGVAMRVGLRTEVGG